MPTDATTDRPSPVAAPVRHPRQTTSRLENESPPSARSSARRPPPRRRRRRRPQRPRGRGGQARQSRSAIAAAPARRRRPHPPGLKKAAAEAEARAAKAEAAAKDAVDHRSARADQAARGRVANKPDPGSRPQRGAAACGSTSSARKPSSRRSVRGGARPSGCSTTRVRATRVCACPSRRLQRGYTDSDREYDSAKDERRRMIKELDGRLGKLEDQKLTHEQGCEGAATHSQIKTLQGQITGCRWRCSPSLREEEQRLESGVRQCTDGGGAIRAHDRSA